MLYINLKPCCTRCPHRSTYTKEDKIYSRDTIIDVNTTIGCEHEKVCMEYNKEQPADEAK